MANDELRKIALAKGEAFAGGGNRPIRLDDPDEAWYVAEGAVDLFVAQRTDDDSEADFKQLLRRQAATRFDFGTAARLAAAVSAEADPERLMAVGEAIARCATGGDCCRRSAAVADSPPATRCNTRAADFS